MHISTVCLVKSQGLQRTLRKSLYKEYHCIPNALKNIGMLCMQELFWRGGWITWNIVSDVYILTKGKKSINAEKNKNVELTHTQVFVVDYVRCANNCNQN